MAQTYFLLPTAEGEAKLANAQALGVPLKFTAMSVGDGNGALPVPTRDRKALINERRRAAINSITQDPQNQSQFIAEQVIPETEGGWWIREAGIHSDDGTLCYYANIPETYKPVLAEGSARTQVIRLVCLNTSGATVELKVDPSIVLATRQYVDTKIVDELDKRDAKQSVVVATTTPLGALSGLQIIDGVALPNGGRVLVKDQVAAKDNGIYVAAAGAWARATDSDSGLDVTPGMLVPVEQGAVNGDSVWQLTTDGAIIIGVTPLSFKRVGDGYFARLDSPDFSGIPKVDTAPPGTATRQAASTAFVANAVAALVAAAPGQLDTLNELAAALGNDANFAATVTAALAQKAALAGAAFTGPVSLVTPDQFANDTSAATTAFVQRALGNMAGFSGYTSSSAIPAASAGKLITVAMPVTGQVLTLPLLSTLKDGALFFFQNLGGTAFSVQRAGADTITANGATIYSQSILPGETGIFKKGSGGWVMSGDCAVPQGYQWTRQHLSTGYQRFPGGLILQWGSQAAVPGGGGSGISFPIAFPTAIVCGLATVQNSAGTTLAMGAGVGFHTQYGMTLFNNGNAAATAISWVAIGF